MLKKRVNKQFYFLLFNLKHETKAIHVIFTRNILLHYCFTGNL